MSEEKSINVGDLKNCRSDYYSFIEDSIDIINKTTETTISGLYDIKNHECLKGKIKRLAYAIIHVQSSINILKKVEEDLISLILKEAKDE